jgi:hypothetical protein
MQHVLAALRESPEPALWAGARGAPSPMDDVLEAERTPQPGLELVRRAVCGAHCAEMVVCD